MSSRLHRPTLVGKVRGFTIVELMVTVAIIGILAGIGFPSFQRLIQDNQERAAASALYDALLIARSEAIKRNTPVQFSFNGGIAGGWTATAGAAVVNSQTALQGTVEFDPANPAVEFDRLGRFTGTANLAIDVAHDSGNTMGRCIRISAVGRPSIDREACN